MANANLNINSHFKPSVNVNYHFDGKTVSGN